MNGADALLASLPPGVVTLGELVSLAVRVDPLLLRRARLELAPDCSAADEADLWFGPLATGRSRAGFALVPALASELRARLAADPTRLEAAWKVTERAHGHLPPTLRLQETVTWLALSRAPDAGARIEHELASALRTMDERPERARGLARWAMEALPALPARARETDAATQLAAAAISLLAEPDPADADRAKAVKGTPTALAKRSVGVELLPSGLRLSVPAAADALSVRVPALPNAELRVRVSDDVCPRVAVPAAGTSFVGLAAVQRFDRPGGTDPEVFVGATVERIAYTDRGGLVIACADGSVHAWESDEGIVRQFAVDGLRAFAVGDDIVAAAGARGGLLWSLTAGREIRRLDGAIAALAFQGTDLLAGYDDGRVVLHRAGRGDGAELRFDSDAPVLDIVTSGGAPFAVLRAGGRLTYFEEPTSYVDTTVAADARRIAFSAGGRHVLALGGQDVVAYATDERLSAVDRLATPALDVASPRGGSASAVLARDGDLYEWDVDNQFGRRVRRLDVARTARAVAVSPAGSVAIAGAPRSLEIATSAGDTYRVIATRDEPEPLAVERDLVAILHVLGSIALSFHVSGLAPKERGRNDLAVAFGSGRVLEPVAFDAFRQACEWALQSAADRIESGAGDWHGWLELLLRGQVPGFEPKMELEDAALAFVEQLRELLRYGADRLGDFEVDIGYRILPSHASRAADRLGTFPLQTAPVPAAGFRGLDIAEVILRGDFFAVVEVVNAGAEAVRELLARRREIGPPPAEERRRALDALLSGEPPRMLEAVERLAAMAVRDPAEAGYVFAAFADLLRRELPVSRSTADRPPRRPPHVELVLRQLVGSDAPVEARAGLDLSATDLRGANFAGASLADVNLTGAWLEGADFTRADLSGAILAGVEASRAVFDDVTAEDADLSNARLQEARLHGADLDGAILRGASLDGAVLEMVRLIGADLTGATLQRSHGHGADLTAAILEGARLTGADLASAKLDDADCRGAVIDAADLRSGTLRGADLTGVDLRDTILDHASLAGVVHDGIRLDGADLSHAELPDDLLPPSSPHSDMPP